MSAETSVPERFTFGLIADVFAALEAHGYQRGDNAHVGRTVGLLLTLVKTYEGHDEPGQVVA